MSHEAYCRLQMALELLGALESMIRDRSRIDMPFLLALAERVRSNIEGAIEEERKEVKDSVQS